MDFYGIFGKMLFLFLKISARQNFPPPLSREEETEYFRKLKEEKDGEARSVLIEHNLRLVAHVVKKYYSSGLSQDDLMSLGTIGLIKAIDTYDPKKGAHFATYAGKCLQNEILMFFRAQKKTSQEISLSETVDVDKDGNPLTYSDIIAVEDTSLEDVELKIRTKQLADAIRQTLTVRERQIVILRYGLNNAEPMTQQQISDKLGISRSYVSRIEKSALEKLKERIR